MDAGDVSLDPAFKVAIYENLLSEFSKGKHFRQVFRSGDRNVADAAKKGIFAVADFQRSILGTNVKEVLMSDTSQIALIRKLYAAMGDVNTFKSLLACPAV